VPSSCMNPFLPEAVPAQLGVARQAGRQKGTKAQREKRRSRAVRL
jgi:hypothetical protein